VARRSDLTRRRFITAAASIGASLAWPGNAPGASWKRERRELYPEGVASGDPSFDSVILWTRRPADSALNLTVEIAGDQEFRNIVATARATVSAEPDWTCRVLAGGLKPAREYWYRFTDAEGNGSRIGRTITAPANNDQRKVQFAFVSCQNANQGAQNAYRRMIFDDERAAPADRLGFVLHLGDFIYEIVWYPEDRPEGMYDRRLRDIVRYPTGEKVSDFHIPVDVHDYRAVYRAYLHDPDLQDARARWPFVTMWDNHEFSWLGWQGIQRFNGINRPAQTRKVAANQAWFEYHPARVVMPGPHSIEKFSAPKVSDATIERYDEHGLGQEPNNLAAITSLKGYRSLRYGSNVDLIITDQRSYRSEQPTERPEAAALTSPDFPQFFPEEAMEILDAGRTHNHGNPPATIQYGAKQVANFRKDQPAQTILGAEQKAWFLERLKSSRAPWKIWGNSTGTLDWRADPQNLPAGLTKPWPGKGYACSGSGDHGSAYVERGEIYDFIREHGITGFATVAGDRHSFWAGLAAKALPPQKFEPVGIAFITGSISAPGLAEALEYRLAKDHPMRPLFLADRPGQAKPQPAVNMLLRHGVRACLEYQKSGDASAARKLSNPELAPHLAFVDMGGHGFAIVRATQQMFETEFVCIGRPLERATTPDGGPVLYRVSHSTRLWRKGEIPKIDQKITEGNPDLSK